MVIENHLSFPDQLLGALRKAKHVVVFTGAGISAESGIPTFRDKLTGLWENFDVEMLATPDAFRRNPAEVWGWYEWRRKLVMDAQPNRGHLAIARLSALIPTVTVITQNVDDLHERAGSTGVVHLHGSLFTPKCFACARPYAIPSKEPVISDGGRNVEPPRCAHCHGRIRPGVVWFGESLPATAYGDTKQAVRECDVLFSIGTSAQVFPAAVIPFEAAERGSTVIQVNPVETSLDSVAQFTLRGQAGPVLDSLVSHAWPT